MPNYTLNELRAFLRLPYDITDEFYLTHEQKDAIAYITTNTASDDYVFVYTNEAAYYYFLRRRNPTRFYTVWFAQPDFYQDEVIRDLTANKPVFILYDSGYWSNNIDEIPKEKRLLRVNAWITQHYEHAISFGDIALWKPKQIL